MQTTKLTLSLLLLVLLSGCYWGEPQTPIPIPPASGMWIASLYFGTLSFAVNNTGTSLTQVGFDLSWECGSQVLYGPVTFISDGQGWPIQDGFFAVTIDVTGGQPLKKVFFQGQFDSTGTFASGTWQGVSLLDEPCEFTWEAIPSK
jgi:hypothetical protein